MNDPTSEAPGDAGSLSKGRPDILLIVLDCARAAEFESTSKVLRGMPFCSDLSKQSVRFERAVAPGCWTIPSHASLFTGLYPWDHRLHSRDLSRLPPELPHLAARLGERGYRTASFSSNPLVSDGPGLTNAFQTAAWGGWWERFVRHLGVTQPPGGRNVGAGPPRGLAAVRRSGLWPATLSASRTALGHPVVFHTANRILRSVRGGPEECPSCVSPWIESSLASWLSKQPADQPVFTFLNLMEAHEPYMLPDASVDFPHRRRALRLHQDFTDWLEGRWSPSPEELATLAELYAAAVQSLDHRIRAIVSTFQKAGRWDSTLMVLTSDHGQALGEEGWLSHGLSISEPVVRVPLWLRLPGAEGGGTSTESWASLVDVAPTLEQFAGVRPAAGRSGVDLMTLCDAPREGPVWAMAEGWIGPSVRDHVPPERLRYLDRVRVSAYLHDTKVSSDGNGEISAVQYAPRPSSDARLSATSVAEVTDRMRAYLRRFETIPGPVDRTVPSVVERLESWGYA